MLTRSLLLLSSFAAAVSFAAGGFAADLLPPGQRPVSPAVHALVGGNVVVRPGTVLPSATIVIREGVIEAVGKEVKAPADARVWDLRGCTVYAGFIEPYFVAKAPANSGNAPRQAQELGSGLLRFYGVPMGEGDGGKNGPGHELSRVTPSRRAVESYVPDEKVLEVFHEIGFTVANVAPERGILRGSSALVTLAAGRPNESVLKPDMFQHAAFETSGVRGVFPASLMGVQAALRQAFLDAEFYARDWADYEARPDGRRRPEFNLDLEALRPVLSGQIPFVIEAQSPLMVDRAARLAGEFGLKLLMVATGQEWRRLELVKSSDVPFIVPLTFPEVSKMPDDDDWAAISLDQLRVWDWAPENPALLRREGIEIALTTHGLSDRREFRKKLRLAIDRGLTERDALAALTTVPAKLCGLDKRLGTVEAGKHANLTVVAGASYFDPLDEVREVWVDGRVFRVEYDPFETSDSAAAKKTRDVAPDQKRELMKKRLARDPQQGRGPLASPRAVLVRGATIWTSGPEGVIEQGSLLVVDGKVAKLGTMPVADETGLPPGSVLIIDGEGKHVSPGLIDAHSHAMILGGVNEGTLPSTAMVRIGDVVNSETDNIYHQLAGGLTTANLLHGSANPIGGHSCVIKLKEGCAPESLKFPGAASGIKFALGENVKQSNWGERNVTRFPQTRMGVRAFMANRFTAAQHYLKEWERYNREGGRQPRRDLELETLGEILQRKRWIHCHSYRQDEILAFLRVMESFGIQVGTLQHVLEGYKVADEIAAHGAGASCFSDWWAYKFEVYDAIPYAGSLMRERGALVSFNSDDSDLARRLYLEAAKAVKYGGTAEEEALKFVTINPAKQLRIDARVGSLEPGKDGDFVIWSMSPLETRTVCLETWIEGKKYFDRALDTDRSAARRKEWEALVAKAKRMAEGKKSSEPPTAAEAQFFEAALEHADDAVNRHCED